MMLKHFMSRQTICNVSRFYGRRSPSWNYRNVSTGALVSPLAHVPYTCRADSLIKNPKHPIANSAFYRFIHSGQETVVSGSVNVGVADFEDSEDIDEVMNEFLSRFVWIMRGKLNEVYSEADKKEIDAMLLIIVEKVVSEMEKGNLEQIDGSAAATVSQDLSQDLWRTVWEVCNVVLEDMKKAKKKEKMKSFIQSEKVKEMARFAGEIGIRGDMLRELRFKWAREELEDSEFYESLERIREEAKEGETEKYEAEAHSQEGWERNSVEGEENAQVVSLPKRSGKIKYKIYGLDLSKPKWAQVADKINETGGFIWPQEPKPISGKCKIVTEKILSLQVDDVPSPLFAEWRELLQPSRVDWIALLHRLKERNNQVYLKVAEILLDEESFQPDIKDYSQLVDTHAKHNNLDDAERLLKKMNEKGITPDILTKTTMVHMYGKAGNLKRANEAFESLKSQGFQPDLKAYKSMIMAYVNAGELKSAESLMRELESKDIKLPEETFMTLLRSYAQSGDSTKATRISSWMEFTGFQPSVESYTCLVEAYSRKGDQPDVARKYFDEIIKLGHKPDDNCIARMVAAYEKKNLLDKGLNLLLQLEKDGIEYGVATYSVLVDWLGKLQLIDEAEDLLGKIAEQGESPSLDVHISLCDMYSRAREEKKALQALGVLEAKKDQLRLEDFERVINALLAGGFVQDAQRMYNLMTAQGFTSETLNLAIFSAQTFRRKR